MILNRISVTLLKCVTNNSYWWNTLSILYYAPDFIATVFKLSETSVAYSPHATFVVCMRGLKAFAYLTVVLSSAVKCSKDLPWYLVVC